MTNAVLITIGLAILVMVGWIAKGFFLAASIPILLRILVGIVIVGSVILLGIVIKDKLKQDKKDDFKGVDR
ncbi:MAG: hypothetical protein WCX07_04600 [Dehalococcoidales bacterium]|mgnify:CR=1 FL=1|jgi:hypothetical protein|nr:hypothetical protein [Dehalococcoidales bacterium]NLT27731.1 hypothetical protein [Dehalococcoidales bacterium]